jgi:hypothetical protein
MLKVSFSYKYERKNRHTLYRVVDEGATSYIVVTMVMAIPVKIVFMLLTNINIFPRLPHLSSYIFTTKLQVSKLLNIGFNRSDDCDNNDCVKDDDKDHHRFYFLSSHNFIRNLQDPGGLGRFLRCEGLGRKVLGSETVWVFRKMCLLMILEEIRQSDLLGYLWI